MTHTQTRASKTRRAAIGPRTLHVVDIENIAGDPLPTVFAVERIRDSYFDHVGVRAGDHVVVACNHLALLDVGVGWGLRGPRYLVRSGPDGADLELLDVLLTEHVAEHYTTVVIASGDGVFAAAATSLAARGCKVRVVSRRESLSARLALAAHEVLYIDTIETAAAAASVPSREVA
jgi:NYN domain